MGIGVPFQPPLHLWSPDTYANLADGLATRKRNYLRMVAGVGEEDGHRELAHVRGFIADGAGADGDPNKACVRLRKPPPDDWKKRVTKEADERATTRNTKPYLTVWSDDPIVRQRFWWAQGAEDVNVAMARLAVMDDEGAVGE